MLLLPTYGPAGVPNLAGCGEPVIHRCQHGLLLGFAFSECKIIAFTGQPAREESNLALTVFRFFYFIPAAAWLPVVSEPWIEKSVAHFALAAAAIAALNGVTLAASRDRPHPLQPARP